MDKFLIRKRKFDDSNAATSASMETEQTEYVEIPEVQERSISKTNCVSTNKKIRFYSKSYLSIGFTWTGDKNFPLPKCIVCGNILSNECMVPSKLKRHFAMKHNDISTKNAAYFERLLKMNQDQSTVFVKNFKNSERQQRASYLVAEIIVKQMKPHNIAESLIRPCTEAIVQTMLGDEALKEIKTIPMSRDTISRRVLHMSEDIDQNVTKTLQKINFFSLQIDESTDISKKSQLLAFVRFINDNRIMEQFLFCQEFETTRAGQDIFNIVNTYFEVRNISWKKCIGICTDGCPSMMGKFKGFIAHAKKQNPEIIFTHCFLHRQVLMAKTLGSDLKVVMDNIVNMINFIKSRPLKSRIFSKICEEMGAQHLGLLLHTEVRWLSRGKILDRAFELKEEMSSLFKEENDNFYELLNDNIWCAKLAYLADIFEYLNRLNLSLQGQNDNILTSCDKLKAFKEKIQLFKENVKKGKLEMFPRTAALAESVKITKLISEHLDTLEENFKYYFPSISIKNFDWVRNPFIEFTLLEYEGMNLDINHQEELTELRNDRTLKLEYHEKDLDVFWISIEEQYPIISESAIKILLQFSTSYLCELGFSALVNIKNRNRERLQTVDEEMRVCLSNIRPRISDICALHQAQVAH